LVKLPPGFSALTALETLDLSNNVLSAFPESLLTLTNLQCLTLNGNNLTTLPTGIKHLKNLEKLYLKKNELMSLVPEIGTSHHHFTRLSPIGQGSDQIVGDWRNRFLQGAGRAGYQ
jgi:Leucine-rich repeat (LRR) protein